MHTNTHPRTKRDRGFVNSHVSTLQTCIKNGRWGEKVFFFTSSMVKWSTSSLGVKWFNTDIYLSPASRGCSRVCACHASMTESTHSTCICALVCGWARWAKGKKGAKYKTMIAKEKNKSGNGERGHVEQKRSSASVACHLVSWSIRWQMSAGEPNNRKAHAYASWMKGRSTRRCLRTAVSGQQGVSSLNDSYSSRGLILALIYLTKTG